MRLTYVILTGLLWVIFSDRARINKLERGLSRVCHDVATEWDAYVADF